jgi:uncharacterized membrane protein YdjX (TVP38/TMEM64 family)
MRRFAPHLLAGCLIAIVAAAFLAGIMGYIDLDAILARREALLSASEARPVAAILAFMAVYIAGMSVGLPLGGVLGLLAGLLFGRWLGLGLVVLAGVISALGLFLAARSTFGATLRRRAGPFYTRVAGGMQANAFAYVLFMRIVPVFPFFVVTLIAALFGVRTRTFALATLLGKVPSAFIYVGLGEEIGRAATMRDLLNPNAFASLMALSLLALGPVAFRKLRPRQAGL